MTASDQPSSTLHITLAEIERVSAALEALAGQLDDTDRQTLAGVFALAGAATRPADDDVAGYSYVVADPGAAASFQEILFVSFRGAFDAGRRRGNSIVILDQDCQTEVAR